MKGLRATLEISLLVNSFILNGKRIQFHEVLENESNRLKLTPYEVKVISIIKDWNSGKDHFTFQTSGSTGKPKTLNFTREQILQSARRTNNTFKLSPGQTVLCCLSVGFVAGFMMIIRALEGNLSLIIEEPSSYPLNAFEDLFIDFVAMTPNQVRYSLDSNIDKFNHLGKLLIGGAGIHPELENKLRNLPCEVFHSYAMTETLTHVALRNISEKQKNYQALPGITFEVDGNDCLKVNDLMLQIYNLQTNDIVRLEGDRSLKWIGRQDLVINTGGIKVQIESLEIDIQRVLSKNAIKVPFCVAAQPDAILSNRIVLLIEAEEETFEEEELSQLLKSKLPKYYDPKLILKVPEIFYTSTGKINRIKNSEAYL